jgi:hypothetical protein
MTLLTVRANMFCPLLGVFHLSSSPLAYFLNLKLSDWPRLLYPKMLDFTNTKRTKEVVEKELWE